jgi:hypothetical protein
VETGGTIGLVTTRELAQKLLDDLPEERLPDAVAALEALERDARLLDVLRQRHPEKSDAELLEDLAVIKQGEEAIEQVRERFADVPFEEIERESVKAVREVRQEMAAERRRG